MLLQSHDTVMTLVLDDFAVLEEAESLTSSEELLLTAEQMII